jgi:hypothetical protein
VGVGTQVVIVVVLGLVKVTVVQISVPTQASAVPHPVAAMLVRREACQRVILGVSEITQMEVGSGRTRERQMRGGDDEGFREIHN